MLATDGEVIEFMCALGKGATCWDSWLDTDQLKSEFALGNPSDDELDNFIGEFLDSISEPMMTDLEFIDHMRPAATRWLSEKEGPEPSGWSECPSDL